MENKEQKKEQEQQPEKVPVKPYTLLELSKFYGVCTRTLKKWINEFKDEVGVKKGRFYSIPQVKIIFKNLCFPHTMDPEQ